MTEEKVFVCYDNPIIVEAIMVVLSECLDLDVFTGTKSLNAYPIWSKNILKF